METISIIFCFEYRINCTIIIVTDALIVLFHHPIYCIFMLPSYFIQEHQLLQAVYLCLTGQLPILHAYLTTPLFSQVGVLCGTLCNWQYDAISKYLRWGRAHCQSRYAKLVREYKQKYPNATTATSAATATTADRLGSIHLNVEFAKAASYLSAAS